MIAKAQGLMHFGGIEEPARLSDAILALAEDGPIPRIF
jgi:hypothetical protein